MSTGLPATELGEAISTLGPSADAIPSSPDDQLARKPAWQSFLREEMTITDADWACRSDVYNALVAD